MRHIENLREARGLGRLRGLSATDPGEPLHIPRCRSVHTFGMRFALDLVWLDGGGSIVRVDRAVPAASGPHLPARAVGRRGARRDARPHSARGRGEPAAANSMTS